MSTLTAPEVGLDPPDDLRAPRPRAASTFRGIGRVGLVVFILVLGYLLVIPLYHLQNLAFSDGAAGYVTAFNQSDFADVLWTTLALATGSVLIAMVVGTGLAIAATRLPRRLRFLQVLPALPIVLPAVATIVGWGFLLSPTTGYINTLLRKLPWWSDTFTGPIDINTVTWIVIVTGIGLAGFVFLFVSGGLRDLNGELLEAAQTSGSSERAAVFKIILPILRPVLLYAFGVVFLLGLGQFTAPLLLGRQQGVNVLSTRMYSLVSAQPADYGAAAALGSPLLLIGIAIVVLQRVGLGDQSRFVTHGGKAFKSNRRPSVSATIAIVLYAVIAILLPLLALVNVALSRFWSGRIEPSKWTLSSIKGALSDPQLIDAVVNSASVSIIAVAIALPLGMVIATVLVRGRKQHRIARNVLDLMVGIPLAVPAVVLGMGFLITYNNPPFVLYGTKWVMVLVYVAIMVPYTTRMQVTGMIAIGDKYTEASRVSGAGALRTNLRIILPLLRPSLGAAAGLMFVLLSQEFSASLLVRSPTTQVMGTALYDYYNIGNYPWVATMGLLMFVITGLGLACAVLIGGRRTFDRV